MVISTPNRDNTARYVGIEGISVAGQRFAVSAYEAARHSSCKGVIRGVSLGDGPVVIENNLVNQRNPTALGAKWIKNTGTVVVLFNVYSVPNFVSYDGTIARCTLFRKQMGVCYCCVRLGHRSDVCPSPNDATWRGCVEGNPDAQHRCDAKCKLYGGDHLTAAKECYPRFQTRRISSGADRGNARAPSTTNIFRPWRARIKPREDISRPDRTRVKPGQQRLNADPAAADLVAVPGAAPGALQLQGPLRDEIQGPTQGQVLIRFRGPPRFKATDPRLGRSGASQDPRLNWVRSGPS